MSGSTHRRTVWAIVIVSALSLQATAALHAETPPDAPRGPHPGKMRPRVKKGTSDFTPFQMISARHQYESLHRAVVSNMDLTPEQKQRIDEMFEEIYMQIETGRGTAGGLVDPVSIEHAKKAGAMDKKIRSAEDLERFRREGALGSSHSAITPFTSRRMVVDIVSEAFHGEQLQQFLKLAARWEALQPIMGLRDGPLMRLRRSISDPQLGIAPSDLENFQIMIGTRMKSFGRNRFDEAATTAAADELRSEILQKLTPQQQEHFLATNRALEEDARLLKEKLAKAGAARKADQPAEKTDAEKSQSEPDPD